MSATPLVVTLNDGSTLEVQPTLQDTLAFEVMLRKNRRWGGLQENALKLQPFKAFSALRREGRLPEGIETWEQFTTGDTAVLDVVFKDDDDDADDTEDDGSEAVDGVGEAGQSAPSTD